MSNFEKYIRQHRPALDDIENPPVDKMWQGVQQELAKPLVSSAKHINLRYWVLGIAASVILLVGIGIGFWLQPSNETLPRLADISPELAIQEAHFQKLIKVKEEEIDWQKIDVETFQDIFEELKLLEQIHQEYRKDIPQFGQEDQLIQTLIRYYEQKIQILERLSKEIELQEHYKNLDHEKLM